MWEIVVILSIAIATVLAICAVAALIPGSNADRIVKSVIHWRYDDTSQWN